MQIIRYGVDGRQTVTSSPFAGPVVPQAVSVTTVSTTEEDDQGNLVQTVVETRIEPVAAIPMTLAAMPEIGVPPVPPLPEQVPTSAFAYAPSQAQPAFFPPLPPIQIALPLIQPPEHWTPRQALASAGPVAPATRDLRISRDPATGHFIAPIRINGVEVRAIIDTGAQETILSARDARATGAVQDVVGSEPMAGIGGYTMLHVVQVRSMEVGGQQLGGFRAAVGQEGIPYTLLGQTEISRLGRIVIEDGVMTISPRITQVAMR